MSYKQRRRISCALGMQDQKQDACVDLNGLHQIILTANWRSLRLFFNNKQYNQPVRKVDEVPMTSVAMIMYFAVRMDTVLQPALVALDEGTDLRLIGLGWVFSWWARTAPTEPKRWRTLTKKANEWNTLEVSAALKAPLPNFEEEFQRSSTLSSHKLSWDTVILKIYETTRCAVWRDGDAIRGRAQQLAERGFFQTGVRRVI